MSSLSHALFWLVKDNAPVSAERFGELVNGELGFELTPAAATKFAKAALKALENQSLVERDLITSEDYENFDGPWRPRDIMQFPEDARPKR